MSNFQRSRSKVWWGDSPPNIGSPVAQGPSWQAQRAQAPAEDDWAPQLPRWAPQGAQPLEDIEESPPLPAINVWRHNSPGSHKSQDSGFSDSDSSPPNQQDKSDKPSKDGEKEEASNNNKDEDNNKCCHGDEVNNNNDAFKTPGKRDLSSNVLNYLQTPKSVNKFNCGTPVRSLIKTPKDLQDYLQAHCDNGHKSLDSVDQSAVKESNVKVVVTLQKNVNRNGAQLEKCSTKRNLVEIFNNYEAKNDGDNLDGVTRPESITSPKSNIEYIQLSPSHQIAVNNQPRMRSPITRISYHPPVHFVSKESSPGMLSNKLNTNNRGDDGMIVDKEDDYGFKTTHHFQRNGMNRSFNYASQRLEISDEGSHSLGYIEINRQNESMSFAEEKNASKEDVGAKAFSSRKITDSLNLKTPKKAMSRTKQKIQSKATKTKQAPKINKSFFNFLPKKNDTIKTIYDITRGHAEVDRVPSLGLPKSHVGNDWVLIDAITDDKNSDSFDERIVDENELNVSGSSTKSKSPKGILKAPGSMRKITPPIQFQDQAVLREKNAQERNLAYRRSTSVPNDFLNGLVIRREASSDDIHFCELELNAACTSTPKSLKPQEFVFNSARAARSSGSRQQSKIRPINLLSNFNDSSQAATGDFADFGANPTHLERLCVGQAAPVQHWLAELAGQGGAECGATLQSKALGVEVGARVASGSATITGNIRKVQTHGQLLAHQYKQLKRDLEHADAHSMHQCNSDVSTLVASISEFVLAHSISLKVRPPGESPERWDRVQAALKANVQRVVDGAEDAALEMEETRPDVDVLRRHLKTMMDVFAETARAVLLQQMRTLVSMLEEPPSDTILKSTLTSLGHLGAFMSPEADLDTPDCEEVFKFLTELPFVECGVPRALLSAIIETNKSSVKALSLRALATICITSDAVKQFEEAGGIEIVSDILNEESNPEPQMREAVTVMTQITAPWMSGDYKLRQLDAFLDIIIKNITGILSRTSCCQLLLLCVACLVNIVNLVKQRERRLMASDEPGEHSARKDVIEMLTRHKTMENVLEAVKKRGPSASVFLQEQTATLINAVSSSSRGRTVLAACPAAAVALVCFLRSPRASPTRAARLQAEFRLASQAAEALARLCNIPEVVAQVVQLEGPARLVRMIRAQRQPQADAKCSDQILANCLRALRAVARGHGNCLEELEDVEDMLMPTLMESVKIYSAKQESYV